MHAYRSQCLERIVSRGRVFRPMPFDQERGPNCKVYRRDVCEEGGTCRLAMRMASATVSIFS